MGTGAILKKTRLVLPWHTKQVSWHHFLQQGGAFHKSPNALIIISSIECQKENTGFHLEVFSIHFNCAYITVLILPDACNRESPNLDLQKCLSSEGCVFVVGGKGWKGKYRENCGEYIFSDYFHYPLPCSQRSDRRENIQREKLKKVMFCENHSAFFPFPTVL